MLQLALWIDNDRHQKVKSWPAFTNNSCCQQNIHFPTQIYITVFISQSLQLKEEYMNMKRLACEHGHYHVWQRIFDTIVTVTASIWIFKNGTNAEEFAGSLEWNRQNVQWSKWKSMLHWCSPVYWPYHMMLSVLQLYPHSPASHWGVCLKWLKHCRYETLWQKVLASAPSGDCSGQPHRMIQTAVLCAASLKQPHKSGFQQEQIKLSKMLSQF